MRDHEVEYLRREFAAQEHGRGKRFPASLRDRATRWAQAQVASGAKIVSVAAAIGVNSESVRRWVRSSPPPPPQVTSTALVPVEIVADATATEVVVETPAGFRIVGLSIAQLLDLLPALR